MWTFSYRVNILWTSPLLFQFPDPCRRVPLGDMFVYICSMRLLMPASEDGLSLRCRSHCAPGSAVLCLRDCLVGTVLVLLPSQSLLCAGLPPQMPRVGLCEERTTGFSEGMLLCVLGATCGQGLVVPRVRSPPRHRPMLGWQEPCVGFQWSRESCWLVCEPPLQPQPIASRAGSHLGVAPKAPLLSVQALIMLGFGFSVSHHSFHDRVGPHSRVYLT